MQTPEEFLEANGLETRTIDRAGLVAAFQKSIDEDNAGTLKTNEMKRAQMQAWKRDLPEHVPQRRQR